MDGNISRSTLSSMNNLNNFFLCLRTHVLVVPLKAAVPNEKAYNFQKKKHKFLPFFMMAYATPSIT